MAGSFVALGMGLDVVFSADLFSPFFLMCLCDSSLD